MPGPDRMTSQLMYLPAIIGKMGINIAEAQKALNTDYIETLHKVFAVLRDYSHARAADGSADATLDTDATAQLEKLLPALAPSRYQFTEATIDFSADLAESTDLGMDAAVGLGMGGVTLGAGMSLAYGYDYRAAARITARLQAYALDETKQQALLARAREIHADKGTLPALTQVDKDVFNAATEALQALTGKDIAARD